VTLDAEPNDMPSGLDRLKRAAVKTLTESLSARRMVAILPLILLCAYWTLGEMALIAFAVLTPLLGVVVGKRVRKPDLPPRDEIPAGLLTRDQLIAWLGAAMHDRTLRNGQLAVVALVIDDIEALEERFGRETRKLVRNEIVRRLQEVLRHEDAVATLDDNVIAFGVQNVKAPETENLLRLSRRLQAICDNPFMQQASRIYCTVSMGIAAELHLGNASARSLVLAAERAGDFAASSGPGSVRVFTEGLISEKEDERRHTRALSNALETGEIFAWFQPQMSSDGLRVIGFEALARWDRPGQGLIMPGNFLPDIQKAGLSQRLAEVVLKQALTALNAWDAAGFDVPSVSVNFSGEDLRNPRLADYVMWELDRFNLAPGRLVIEVLESVIAEKHEDAITRTLRALSKAGCAIDLDDFGTGFTSIINIRRFNVSRIKIDRRLVSRLDKDAEQRRMVAALLSFSSKLGIEALAEGVETEEERSMLRKLGCPNIQGYIAARPMPLGETLLWLEDMPAAGAARLGDGSAISA
jgi:EAL domain-containing protein (putative c-di-GMP-specific phosphodiesterase class I)/GGDEF domain-containing protein